jgi:hypothetical protein
MSEDLIVSRCREWESGMRMVAMDEKDSGVIYVVEPEVDVIRWLVKVSHLSCPLYDGSYELPFYHSLYISANCLSFYTCIV